MSQIVLGVLANLLRAYAISRILRQFCMPKEGRAYLRFATYLTFVAMTSGGYYLFHSIPLNLATNLTGLYFIMSQYKRSILQRGFLTLGIYSLNALLEALVFASLVGFYGSQRYIYESYCECIANMGILLITIILERTKVVKNRNVSVNPKIWIALIGTHLAGIGGVLALLDRELSGRDTNEIEVVCILAANLSVFYLFGTIQEYYKDREEKIIIRQQMEWYSYELDLLKESYGNIQKLRHDMKHHMMELRYLAEGQGGDSFLAYLEEMEKSLISDAEYVSSGNKNIDGTLNYLLRRAKESLDKVDVDIAVPQDLELHSYQVNAVLGNLLENAVYAAENSQEKYLGIQIKTDRNLLCLSIQNSYAGTIQTKEKKLVSTKSDPKIHGIGLESVRKILDDEHGTLDMKWDGKMFCTEVMMYLSNAP